MPELLNRRTQQIKGLFKIKKKKINLFVQEILTDDHLVGRHRPGHWIHNAGLTFSFNSQVFLLTPLVGSEKSESINCSVVSDSL